MKRKKRIFILSLVLSFIVVNFIFTTTYANYVGSVNSNIYHYNGCQWAYRIYSSNRIEFSTVQKALSYGYRPCKVCQPPTYDRIIYKLRLDSPPQNMQVGDSAGFKWTYWPDGAIDNTITFTSSNPEVAKILNGCVFAESIGKTVITASTPNNVKYSYTLNVVKTPVEQITIKNEKSGFYINENYTLHCEVYPDNATNKDFIYSSTNPDILSINEKGEIIAKKEGECKLIIKCDGVTKEVPVYVYYVKSQQIKASAFFMAIENSEKKLNVEILPFNATDKSYKVWSSNESVAKIQDGKIKAKKTGIATVYINTSDGVEKTAILIVHNIFIDIVFIILLVFLIFIIKVKLYKKRDIKEVQ